MICADQCACNEYLAVCHELLSAEVISLIRSVPAPKITALLQAGLEVHCSVIVGTAALLLIYRAVRSQLQLCSMVKCHIRHAHATYTSLHL